eukprot:scaffold268963_cov26-Tisochrysis_lutea.AAC.1
MEKKQSFGSSTTPRLIDGPQRRTRTFGSAQRSCLIVHRALRQLQSGSRSGFAASVCADAASLQQRLLSLRKDVGADGPDGNVGGAVAFALALRSQGELSQRVAECEPSGSAA